MDEKDKRKTFERFDFLDDQRGFMDRLFYEIAKFDDVDLVLEEVKKLLKNHPKHLGAIRKNFNKLGDLVNAGVSDIEKEMDAENTPSKTIRAYELAKILNVSKPAVTSWIKRGHLKASKNGDNIEISHRDVDSFVQIYKKYARNWEEYKSTVK